jgi:hypothetical protein
VDVRDGIEHDADRENLDGKLVEVDERVLGLVNLLAADHLRRADIPVEVVHGKVSMRPPLLLSIEAPDGVRLEDLLEQLLKELTENRPSQLYAGARENSLVITNLEQALLWRRRALEVRGEAEFMVTAPRAVG